MTAVRLRVPASTANLGPGFDCLSVAVGLHLRVDCRPAASFQLTLAGEGADTLPPGADNLLVRCMLDAGGLDALPAVHLRVDNDVPLQRGLGSSSAAIVAGLALGHALRGESVESLDRQQLLARATRIEGHADNVAAAIFGDLMVAGVEEHRVIALPQHWPADLIFAAVIPELEVSTTAARSALPDRVDFLDAVGNCARLARLLASLLGGRYDDLGAALADRLHEPYRLPLATGLSDVLQSMRDHPRSLGAYLSGSGSTLMALARDADAATAVGERAVAEFTALGVTAHHRVLSVDRDGLTSED